MLRLSTSVHVIDGLGAVIISGAINCNTPTIKEKDYTVVEEVKFYSSENLQTVCKPELWIPFENVLKSVLERFGEVEKLLQFPQHKNDTI